MDKVKASAAIFKRNNTPRKGVTILSTTRGSGAISKCRKSHHNERSITITKPREPGKKESTEGAKLVKHDNSSCDSTISESETISSVVTCSDCDSVHSHSSRNELNPRENV